MNRYILGFSDSLHDRSACIFKNNSPVIAIEEERLSRVKHGLELYKESRKNPSIFSQLNLEKSPSYKNEKKLEQAIDYCLKALGITENDIDFMVGNSLHFAFPFRGKSIYLNHHLAHASATFYASGFNDAAIFVADGYGDPIEEKSYETVMLAKGNGLSIKTLKTVSGSVSSYYDMENSLGVFYRIGSLLSGFGMFDEGKTMGLSAYGKPTFYSNVKKFINFKNNTIHINNGGLFDTLSNTIKNRDKFEIRADIASTFQKVLEEMALYYVNHLYDITKSKNLCIAGGVGLNCVMNAKLLEKSKFKNIFIFPAAGDNGISFGAAYFVAHNILKLPRTKQLSNSYFGKSYTREETMKILNKYSSKIRYEECDHDKITTTASKLLIKNEVIMWFQEGSEFGPRALGHRSCLGNPRSVRTRDYINSSVKFRESFRPLAPIILEEYVDDFFNMKHPSPFMLLSPSVKKITKKIAAGIVHIDNTSRLQTINKKQNKKIYDLISKFHKETGSPIILNTSFNNKDEPIVETPDEAIKSFLISPLEHLFIDNFYITKK